ncbi:hypothetical protein GIB67_024324 [Kingdonia uniflora]|uniref:KIB1-4 beta-propeller domain-containing protein n=1 Tax=Kingdonia uniflora TaxID=39325 RepID=A0A7J7LFC0_9MAGN|nr:hypothetical protein GIB67_024324 [Kingdonia uniflora]
MKIFAISSYRCLGVGREFCCGSSFGWLVIQDDGNYFDRMQSANDRVMPVVKANDGELESTVRFYVLKLDPIAKKWVEMKTLCGHMIFLGCSSAVSVSASDYPGCKPNCIYYASKVTNYEPQGMRVFNVEDGSSVSHHSMEQMFLPPCIWILPIPQQRSKISREPAGVFTTLRKAPSTAPDVNNVDNLTTMELRDRKRQAVFCKAREVTFTAHLDKCMTKVDKEFLCILIVDFSEIHLQEKWSLADAEDVKKILENYSDLSNVFKILIFDLKDAVNDGLHHLKLVENAKQEHLKLSVEQSRLDNNVDSVQVKVDEEMRGLQQSVSENSSKQYLVIV